MTLSHTQLMRQHRERERGDMDEAFEMLSGDAVFYDGQKISRKTLSTTFPNAIREPWDGDLLAAFA